MEIQSSFADATAVEPDGPGRWRGCIAPEWGLRGRPNGGYLMAIAARAAMVATGRAHPHAVTGSFVRTPAAGPVHIDVETVKSGRQLTQVRCCLRQNAATVLDALVVLGDPPTTPPAWHGVPDPRPAPYAECVPVPPKPGRVGLLERLDIRYDPAASPLGPRTPHAAVRAWVSFADGPQPDPLRSLLIADVLPASIQSMGWAGWAPTVQMTTYLRAVPAPGPLAVAVAGRLLTPPWFDEVADVYDHTGQLVAQARQIALVSEEAR
jgi:acyl-CoA thioesterase